MIGVFGKIAADFGAFYTMSLEFQHKIVILREVTAKFNLPTDVKALKDLNRRRRQLTTLVRKQKHAELAGKPKQTRPLTDAIPVEMNNVSFRYTPDGNYILKIVCVSANQSSLIAVSAEPGQGRYTFMRCLALKLFPES